MKEPSLKFYPYSEPYVRRRDCDAGEGMRVFRKQHQYGTTEPVETEFIDDGVYAG